MRDLVSSISRRLFRPAETLSGYDEPELVDVIFRKTLAYKPHGTWPEMIRVSTTLDFGGGCGIHYKLASQLSPEIRWAVVETPEMARKAAYFETDHLRFFTDIDRAADWLGDIQVMHSNSALQYTPDPIDTLRRLCSLRAKAMLWERVTLSINKLEREEQLSLLGDNGPGTIAGLREKTVRYVRTKMPEPLFLEAHAEYELVERGPDWFKFTLR